MPKNKSKTEQVGGTHYQDYVIQPIDFIYQNEIPSIEANIIKYVLRHRDKNGLEDLQKAAQYIEYLMENEYGS